MPAALPPSRIRVLDRARIAGTDIEHAACVQAGDWIFLCGIEASDPAAGLIAGVAPPPGLPFHGAPKHRREADAVFARMHTLLESAGSSLAHACRVDQYYTTWKAVDPYHTARRAAFGKHIPPSTSIVMAGLAGAPFEMSVSLIAVRADAGRAPQRVSTDRLGAPVWSGFAPALTSGDFVFIAGQMARAPDGSHDPRAHRSPHSLWGGTEIRRQTEHIVTESLVPALAAAGASPAGALKAQIYLRHIDDLPHVLDVWNAHFGERSVALTVVPAREFGHVGADIEINLVALRDGAAVHKQIVCADVPAQCCFGAPAVRAGDLLLLSGLVPADADGPVDGGAAARAWPGLAIETRAQMHWLLACAQTICTAGGTSLADVVRAQCFATDAADLPALHREWQLATGTAAMPFAFACTPAPQAVPAGRITLDLWAYAP